MDYHRYSDESLLVHLKSFPAQKDGVFKEIYRRYAARVRAYCFGMMDNADEAEDIFQETFIRLYRMSEQEHQISNVAGYIFRIARNLCFDRKQYKKRVVSLDDILDNYGGDVDAISGYGVSTSNITGAGIYTRDDGSDIASTLEQEELFRIMNAALSSLDVVYREAFVLREYEHLSYEEIADITGTYTVTARSRVFRAKQKLQDLLQPYIKDLEQL